MNINLAWKLNYPTQVKDLTLVNLNIALDLPSGWNISAYCNNCTDDNYMMVALAGARNQGGGNRYSLGEGRRLGLQLSKLNFNKYFYKKRHPSGAVFLLG